jgi:hypothetical protein
MTAQEKDACEPTDKKLEQSREAERRRIVEEYVMELREIVKKLRRKLSTKGRLSPAKKAV